MQRMSEPQMVEALMRRRTSPWPGRADGVLAELGGAVAGEDGALHSIGDGGHMMGIF